MFGVCAYGTPHDPLLGVCVWCTLLGVRMVQHMLGVCTVHDTILYSCLEVLRSCFCDMTCACTSCDMTCSCTSSTTRAFPRACTRSSTRVYPCLHPLIEHAPHPLIDIL